MEAPPPPADPYLRLRHPPDTSEEDRCRCDGQTPVVLQGRLEPNPLACLVCNREVAPGSLPLTGELADELACWRDVHDSLYLLWLDAGEFQEYARSQLKTPSSPLHNRGLALVARLNGLRPTYYWWFTDQMFEQDPPLPACPRCQSELTPEGRLRICTLCRIVVSP